MWGPQPLGARVSQWYNHSALPIRMPRPLKGWGSRSSHYGYNGSSSEHSNAQVLVTIWYVCSSHTHTGPSRLFCDCHAYCATLGVFNHQDFVPLWGKQITLIYLFYYIFKEKFGITSYMLALDRQIAAAKNYSSNTFYWVLIIIIFSGFILR